MTKPRSHKFQAERLDANMRRRLLQFVLLANDNLPREIPQSRLLDGKFDDEAGTGSLDRFLVFTLSFIKPQKLKIGDRLKILRLVIAENLTLFTK